VGVADNDASKLGGYAKEGEREESWTTLAEKGYRTGEGRRNDARVDEGGKGEEKR